MSAVLDGVRVLEWAAWHQGPAAGSMLGDLGADVIKIEDRTAGDPFRGVESFFGTSASMTGGINMVFEITNRSKRSITLDLRKDQGRQILFKLVEKSDVFLTNYPLSTVKKLGIDYEGLSAHNPRLVYAVGSGLGTKGPDAEGRTFDTIAQARSGIMFMISDRDHTEPYQIVGGVIDQLGAMELAYAIVAALLAREHTGTGQYVEASLLSSALYLQINNLGSYLLSGRARARHARNRAKNPLTNQYKCQDGKWTMLAAFQSDRFWPEFCKAIGHPELEHDARFKRSNDRGTNCKQLIAILDAAFATKPRDEWLATFKKECPGLPFAPVLEISDLATDPQVLANDYVTQFQHPSLGNIKLVNHPVRFDKTPAVIKSGAPAFGQHTEEVLLEFGYTWEDISQLKQAEVI